MSNELDTKVKLAIYEITAKTGRIPDAPEISRKIDINENEVLSAFARLHAKRLLVPEPGDPTRIRMAPPFSGVPTAFPVEANGRRYYANCVWDAYGIAAALHAELVREGIRHEYHAYPGDHSVSYFLSHFAEVMEFHSKAFGLLPEH